MSEADSPGTPDRSAIADAAPGASALEAPVIPWQHRTEIGRRKAYWKTVFYVIGRFGRLDRELAGPADLRAARQFRTSTLLSAFVALLATGLLCARIACSVRTQWDIPPAVYFLVWPVAAAAGLLFLFMLAGIATWFFAPRRWDRRVQDRAIAMSYYMCAPLSFLAYLAVPLAIIGLLVSPRHAVQILWASVGCLLLLVFLWYVLLVAAARTVARRSAAGTCLTALGLLACWLIIPQMVFLVPAGIAMWTLMYKSLT